MKKSKLVLISLGAICLAIISFFILDYKNVKEEFKNKDYNFKLDSEFLENKGGFNMNRDKELFSSNLDEFDEVNMNFTNSAVEIKKSSENKVTLYEENGKKSSNEIKIEKDGRIYKFSNIDDKNINMVIETTNPETLNVNYNSTNAFFTSEEILKSFKTDVTNGAIVLTGEDSYPINIDSTNAAISLTFKNYDAKIKVDNINGVISMLGENGISFSLGKDSKKYREKVMGSGRDEIRIDSVNGAINISE